jgi:ribosomal protein S18 acetylase RimI-like enzyme
MRNAPDAAAPAVALRPFGPADHASLLSWVRDAEELYLFSGGSLSWPVDEAQLDALQQRPGTTEWTAVTGDGERIGHLATVAIGDREARLARVIVAPTFRGRGLARPMVEAALRMLRTHGRTELALHVVPGNEPALRTYRSLGFAETAPNPAHPEFLRMRLALPPEA